MMICGNIKKKEAKERTRWARERKKKKGNESHFASIYIGGNIYKNATGTQ